jgi:exodeoxyribonuclease-5
MEDFLNDAFGNPGQQESVIICRTNKRANLFNQQIRTRILQREFELEGGDIMMVVKNNYYWLDTDTEAGFVANGDLIEVLRVIKSEEKFGFKFADVQLKLLDYPEMPAIDVKLLLDSIHADGPDIARADSDRLFHAVEDSYGDIPQRKGRLAKIRVDPWYNALHVKFGYALTCHKTQGGQWKNVFIDQGYLTEDHINKEFLRWLYTAVTRATEKLYLMGFNSEFVSEEDNEDTKD